MINRRRRAILIKLRLMNQNKSFFVKITMFKFHILTLIDILFLGSCTRFSFTLIKWCSQLVKITIPTLSHPLPSLINWPINKVQLSANFPMTIYPHKSYVHYYPIHCMCVNKKIINVNFMPVFKINFLHTFKRFTFWSFFWDAFLLKQNNKMLFGLGGGIPPPY